MNGNGIKKLNDLYWENGLYGLMAISYLLQIGFDRAKALTDEEIQKVKENTPEMSILSADFNEWLMTTTRELANEITAVELLQWVQVNKPYDTKGIKRYDR